MCILLSDIYTKRQSIIARIIPPINIVADPDIAPTMILETGNGTNGTMKKTPIKKPIIVKIGRNNATLHI